MRLFLIVALFMASYSGLSAQTLVAARNIPAQTVVEAQDFLMAERAQPGAISDPASVLGMETRVAIYAGRPIFAADFGPPAMVARNAIVALEYRQNGLLIRTEGRALGRAGVGESLRVINLASKTTVYGIVAADGSVLVGGVP